MSGHMNGKGTNDKMPSMDNSDIGRQGTTVTMHMSDLQYERLFFQPEKPKGDLSKRLGNPTLLGLIGLLVPFQTTMWCLVQFKGSNSTSLVGTSGALYFMGGIAMNIAGIAEFVLGNTFPFAVFIIYGCHFLNEGFTGDPTNKLLEAFGTDGALSKPWNSGQGNYALVMAMITFIFLLGSLRTNVPMVVLFFTLIILFGFVAAANYQVAYNPTAEGMALAADLLRIGGGFGFVTALMGWYLAIITVCASTGVPCPLPIFDLSQRMFINNKVHSIKHAEAMNHGGMPA